MQRLATMLFSNSSKLAAEQKHSAVCIRDAINTVSWSLVFTQVSLKNPPAQKKFFKQSLAKLSHKITLSLPVILRTYQQKVLHLTSFGLLTNTNFILLRHCFYISFFFLLSSVQVGKTSSINSHPLLNSNNWYSPWMELNLPACRRLAKSNDEKCKLASMTNIPAQFLRKSSNCKIKFCCKTVRIENVQCIVRSTTKYKFFLL